MYTVSAGTCVTAVIKVMSLSHGYCNSSSPLIPNALVLHAFRSKAHTLQNELMLILLPFSIVRPITLLADSQSSLETLMEGGDIILTCTSEGNPAPSFTWRRDGVTLSSTLYTNTPTDPTVLMITFTRTNGMTTSVLTISGAVYPDDDGVYECVGTNSHTGIDNSSSASITVTVQGTTALSAFEV